MQHKIELRLFLQMLISFQARWQVFLLGVPAAMPVIFLPRKSDAWASYSSVAYYHSYNREISNNSKHKCSSLLVLFVGKQDSSCSSCDKNTNRVGKVRLNCCSSKIDASISMILRLEQVQSPTLTNRSAVGGQIYSYLALMNRQVRASSCRFYMQIIMPLRLEVRQLARIWSSIWMQWNRVSLLRGILWHSSMIHDTTSSRIYRLMGSYEEIQELALGALDTRQSLTVVDWGLAVVLSPILLRCLPELPLDSSVFRVQFSALSTFCELFRVQLRTLPSSPTFNLFMLLLPVTDILPWQPGPRFLVSLARTRRWGSLGCCYTCLGGLTGVTPLRYMAGLGQF